MTRQAKIVCPHCGKPITVNDRPPISKENAEKIFAAADAMFKDMQAQFKKIFDPKLWR